MDKLGLGSGWVVREERRSKDRRRFSYTAFFPDRRTCIDRRCRIPLHLVELEDEEIESLLESFDEP